MKYIFLLLGGIALIVGAFFGSKLLCIYVRKPLVEYCRRKRCSASPWLILICMGTGIYLMNIAVPIDNVNTFSEFWADAFALQSVKNMIFCYGGIALAVLPTLILLIRARKYFIPVLLIKLFCILMDPLYLLHLTLSKDGFVNGATTDAFMGGRQAAHARAQSNGGASQSSGYVDGDEPRANGYVEEKYQDQYRVSQEADKYHTASSDGEERYYSGDYVPFVSEGEVTEVRTYDSDTAPMD